MGKVILGTTMSLDGFINDRNGEVGRLYPDLAELRKTKFLQESIETTGAVIMGRRAYDMAQGDLTDYEYQVPIFVITHHVPDKVARGQNQNLSVSFVTDGVENAVKKAKAAAGNKDVTIIGTTSIGQQCLKAGVVDELEVGIVPILLGEGLRFFENLELVELKLERIRVIESPDRTDIRFRVVK